MFEKYKTLFRARARELVPFDPAVFEDELAMKTSWNPAVSGGFNFGTHKLKLFSPERMVFSASMKARLFIGIFFAAGLGIIISIPLLWDELDLLGALGTFILGGGFLGCAFFFGSRMCELRSFDRREGCFWKGRWKRGDGALSIRRADLKARLEKEALKDYIDLADVYAIQLIKEYVPGSPGGDSRSSPYYSYELNLVLKDGERKNVVDHGNLTRIRADAIQLGEFLGNLPVWDAT